MDRRSQGVRLPFGGRKVLSGLVWAAALSAIPLSFAFGCYLQIRKYDEARASLQTVSDRAAIDGAWVYFTNRNITEAERRISSEEAVGTLLHRWERSQSGVKNVRWKLTVDAIQKRFDLDVTGQSATVLSALPLVQSVPIKVSTSVDPTRQSLEVALILDSSSSLNDLDQFSAMRHAAKDYVNDLIDVAGTSVKISVVPWAALVNINSESVGPADDTPVRDIDYLADGSRRSPPKPFQSRLAVLTEPLDPDTPLSLDRLGELSRPTQWRGCVRSSPGEVQIDANSTVVKSIDDQPPPTGLWPVGLLSSSIQTPFVGQCLIYQDIDQAPEPEDAQSGRPTQAQWRRSGGALWSSPSHLQKAELERQCVKWSYSNSIHQCLDPSGPSALTDHKNGTLNAFQPTNQICSSDRTSISPTPSGVNAACLSDPNEIDYVQSGGAICPWETSSFQPVERGVWGPAYRPIAGPNLNCPAAILPLTSNRRQVLDKLDEIYPVPGGSQSDVGLAWALRTLSPRRYWTQFWGLDERQSPSPFGSGGRKIAVLITDGRNEAPIDFEGYYGCTGTSRRGSGNCWRSGNLAELNLASLDALTLSACQVMRETYGVKVYVILTNSSNPSARAIATRCTGSDRYVLTPSPIDLEYLLKSSFSDLLSASEKR